LISASGSASGNGDFSAGKVSWNFPDGAIAPRSIRRLVAAMTPEELFTVALGLGKAMAGRGMSL
jgi:hypothetical protein